MPKTILTEAAAILRAGGLVVLPTETVYGLGANALDPKAVARIYRVKGRPPTSPLIVHVASIEMARVLAREWSADAELLASRYWPGPLSLVVPKQPCVPDIVTSGLDTVGLRMPAHELTLEVIRLADVPVAAPSANHFTKLSPTTAQHVRDALGDDVDLIIDGGPCEVGIESTVLSLAGPEPVLLRPGMIAREELECTLGRKILVAGTVEGAHPSPGMHDRHYSPKTPVILIRDGALPPGRGVYLWRLNPSAGELSFQMPLEAEAYAKALYDALHRADQAKPDWIAVEMPPDTPAWAGVQDRLTRSATKE